MEINISILQHILIQTKCEWTRGYLGGVIDIQRANDLTDKVAIAQEILERWRLAEARDPNVCAKISAIKEIRSKFGYFLQDAKKVCDKYWASRVVELPSMG